MPTFFATAAADPGRRRRSRRAVLVVALAAVLPLLACVLFSWVDARQHERRDAELAAHVVRNQVATILAQGQRVANELVPLSAAPCDQVAADLRRRRDAEPYFRSLMLVEPGRVYCSSVLGVADLPLSRFAGLPAELPQRPWVRMLPGTPLRPRSPALLIGRPGVDGRSVVAVVDGQYLLDLLGAITPLTAYQIELRIGDGITLRSGEPPSAPDEALSLFGEETGAAPARIDVEIIGTRSRMNQAWGQRLVHLMPFAVLLAGVLVWLSCRSQRSGRSAREQLLRAIDAGEFHVEYQPVYGVASGRCEGVEALLRWDRTGGRPVSPELFIPQAEASHVIVPLTRHLLSLVARDCREWFVEPGFHVAVNVASEHLSGEYLQTDMHAFVEQLAAQQLQVVLEVTEHSLIANAQQAHANLSALRARGVRVSIDDFGTGYCSLSYLQSLPFDLLKIDRAFVQTIDPAGQGDAPVLDTVIGLAHRLGAELIAEGVETAAQFDYLRERGVSFVQGFLYARPMRAEAFARWYAAGEQHALSTEGVGAAGA